MRRAVGLVEMVVGALMLAAALVVVFQALGVGVRGTEQIGDELVAAQAASDIVDMFASAPRLTASPAAPPDALAQALGLPYERVVLPRGFSAQIEVRDLPDAGDGRAKLVRASVSWNGRTIAMARLVTDEVGLER